MFKHVMDGLYFLQGIGLSSNVYLFKGEKEALIIDAGLADNALRIVKGIKGNTVKIKAILCTHSHIDHIGGVSGILRAYPKAKVLAHEKLAQHLEEERFDIIYGGLFPHRKLNFSIHLKLREGMKIEVGDWILKVLYTPGHTDDSICLYDEDKELLVSGDTVFVGGIGRMDLPTGSIKDMIKSLERLSNLNVEALLPGHGPYVLKNGLKWIKLAREWL